MIGLRSRSSILFEAVTDGGFDCFDESVVQGRLIVDIFDFTRFGAQVISTLYRSYADWLGVAQECKIHSCNHAVACKLFEMVVDDLEVRLKKRFSSRWLYQMGGSNGE